MDYCNAILAGASKSTTDKLQPVMNAAARVVSDTRKYDRGLTIVLHDVIFDATWNKMSLARPAELDLGPGDFVLPQSDIKPFVFCKVFLVR